MSMFFGSSKPTSGYDSVRRKQIQSLLEAPLHIQASTETDNMLYHAPFRTNGVYVKLVIQLPMNFPSVPPVIRLNPALAHPWIDAQGNVTGCAGLNAWTIHSNLGQTVADIQHHLIRNPPDVGSGVVQPKHNPYASNPVQSYGRPSQPTSSPVAASPYAGYRPPPPASHPPQGTTGPYAASTQLGSSSTGVSSDAFGVHMIPELTKDAVVERIKDMDADELQQLNDDSAKQLEFFETSPYVGLVRDVEKAHREEVERLARSNLVHEPELEALRKELLSLSGRVEELEQRVRAKEQRFEQLSREHQPDALHTQLRIKISEADEASEDVVSRFRDGDIDAREFLKQFQEKRKIYHERRLKEERLKATPQ
eukprot:TRINITY_DN7526_c0_g1_i2.p1 TRINITY_DN7526_c0_g1~~TRINITY_DN7526_c0_g1_i2.p1  ORF type:complete len:367 (+),score=64.26 TRINITY_DN7526_c0_g1_i2:142-1242(+)